METIELADLGEKKLHCATNQSSLIAKLYERKSDEFA